MLFSAPNALALELIAAARARAQREGISAEFICANAQTHPFEAERLDLIVSRFGVMFFDDPPRAFANLHRAMRKGGRLAFVCWQALHKNPWMSVPMMAASRNRKSLASR